MTFSIARHVRLRPLALLAIGAALLLAVTGCATIPRAAVPSGTALTSLLPPDAIAYASVKVSRNPAVVSGVLRKSGSAGSVPLSILDKTHELYASVQKGPEGKPVYSIVARGSYPIGLINWKLRLSGQWRRNDVPLEWWRDSHSGTELALPTRNLLLVSNGELPIMLRGLGRSGGASVNPQIQQLFAESDLAIYFPKVSSGLPILGIETRRFPVQSFYLAIDSDGPSAQPASSVRSGYHGYAVFKMNSERDARLFSVVFRLLIASAANGRAIKGFPIPLEGATLALNGRTIRLNGISVSQTDLVDLLSAVISGKGGTP